MSLDPAVTNPEHYKVIFENDKVRVLEYTDQPGGRAVPSLTGSVPSRPSARN
jgi:hypothetical protein